MAKGPWHLNINSFPTDLISNLSEILDKSRIIFWKSLEGRVMIEEKVTSGSSNSSSSGSINFNF